MWFKILIIFAVVGAILGYLSSDKNEQGAGAFSGCLTGLFAGGSCLFRIFLAGLSILFILWLFSWLFG